MKYRKKPVVIDAEQFFFPTPDRFVPLSKSFSDVICVKSTPRVEHPSCPHIHTLEGAHMLTDGDYIIRGVAGEFYPCKPDIFAQTYEVA